MDQQENHNACVTRLSPLVIVLTPKLRQVLGCLLQHEWPGVEHDYPFRRIVVRMGESLNPKMPNPAKLIYGVVERNGEEYLDEIGGWESGRKLLAVVCERAGILGAPTHYLLTLLDAVDETPTARQLAPEEQTAARLHRAVKTAFTPDQRGMLADEMEQGKLTFDDVANIPIEATEDNPEPTE